MESRLCDTSHTPCSANGISALVDMTFQAKGISLCCSNGQILCAPAASHQDLELKAQCKETI